MLTALCNQEIHWLGLRTRVPEDWQVVRHGLLAARGQLIFVDRYRQRMQLTWVQCDGEPDLDRMLADDRSRQIEQHPTAILRPLENVPGWAGSVRAFDGGASIITRAIRFDPQTLRLLEVSVITSAGADDATLAPELLSETVVTAPADGATHWNAFDLDVATPGPDWRLTATNVVPADVTFTFTQIDEERGDRPTGGVATFRRLGMADNWWRGPATARTTLNKLGGTLVNVADGSYLGRAATRAEGYEPGPRLKRLLGLLRRRRDALFHCASCNAVYLISVLSPRTATVEPDAFLVCCRGPKGACGDA